MGASYLQKVFGEEKKENEMNELYKCGHDRWHTGIVGCLEIGCACKYFDPTPSIPPAESHPTPTPSDERPTEAPPVNTKALERYQAGRKLGFEEGRSSRDAQIKELVEALEKISAGPKPGDDCGIYYRSGWVDSIAEQALAKFKEGK